MGKDIETEDFGEYASPACFLHELDPSYLGFPANTDARLRDIMAWREAERQRLIESRLALSLAERAARTKRIIACLDRALGDVAGRVIGVYWPRRGEPDLRDWMGTTVLRGARCALPVMVRTDAPLLFRTWRSGKPLDRGPSDIRSPRTGETVTPDVVIAPLVGFDPRRYRLGYGRGWYDRTLAALPVRPRAIGVGYAEGLVPTIYPQPHELPMDAIITDGQVEAI